ncbi:CoA-binding protein [Rhodospirillum centenum]|uniref:CoA binding domain protein n=1 Tax=Rhodospirillum centenum (strain ATCC 51521 / SW) TaxID=414684 RepID=B6IMQ7_RHOCS|nr:CoA-binding protein [Rhodospirillum centenum]ACI98723.1 CoA binding domain protein [Rhodospirillum centenum SW]
MDHDRYPDSHLRAILERVRTIALVGASADPSRPSHGVMAYLAGKGYRVIPVNPGLAGQQLLGETVRAGLGDIEGPVDMVDIFRNSEAAGPIAVEAAERGIPVVWMQLGVRNDAAAARAEALGTTVIMNRCPKIDHERLFGAAGHGHAGQPHEGRPQAGQSKGEQP